MAEISPCGRDDRGEVEMTGAGEGRDGERGEGRDGKIMGSNVDFDVYDLWVDKDESREVYGIEPVDVCVAGAYDAVVLCVGHEEFRIKGFDWVASLGKETSVLYDVKNLLPVGFVDGRL